MGDSDLDRLIKESEDAIKRLDALQQRKHNTPILQRIKNHFAKNSAHLTNVLLAGSVLAVALGRLAQKHEHQAEKEEWERQQQRLEAEKQRAEERARGLLSSTEQLVVRLEEAAATGRQRDLPQLVRKQLEEWRLRVSGQQQPAAGAAPAPPAAASSDASSSSSDGSGGSKIMF